MPIDSRLHVTHVWASSGGSLVADVIEQDGDATPGTRTLLIGPNTLSGCDVWLPPAATLTIAGTAGFHGWLEPAIP